MLLKRMAFSGNEKFYSNVLMPTVHRLVDPETAHNLAVWTANRGLVPRCAGNHEALVSTQLKD